MGLTLRLDTTRLATRVAERSAPHESVPDHDFRRDQLVTCLVTCMHSSPSPNVDGKIYEHCGCARICPQNGRASSESSEDGAGSSASTSRGAGSGFGLGGGCTGGWRSVFGAVSGRELRLYECAPWSPEAWASPSITCPLIATSGLTNTANCGNPTCLIGNPPAVPVNTDKRVALAGLLPVARSTGSLFSPPPFPPSSWLRYRAKFCSACVAGAPTRAHAARVYTSVGRRDTFAVVCPANITGRDRPCLVHAIVSWPGLQIFSRRFLRERVSPGEANAHRGKYRYCVRCLRWVCVDRQVVGFVGNCGFVFDLGRVGGWWRGSKCRNVSDTGMC
ncbi:hypothetical protein K0M31_013563 [Melipona bicolor]|uniref:Uncharacterized protein n=1 Tax=Melipona bicolor TaxID=60889 RepID=A0AA40KG33_9HYME|nr:hypothetical protein K0M31_013563 [Melipona bicolor]